MKESSDPRSGADSRYLEETDEGLSNGAARSGGVLGRRSADASNGLAAASGADRKDLGGASGKPSGRRDALAVRGQAKGEGAILGEGFRRRAAGAGGAGSSSSGAADPERGPSAASRDRSDVAEFLADPANRKAGADGQGAGADEENTDVVLSVPLNRETGVAAADATSPIAEQDLQLEEEGVRFEPGSVLAFPDAGNIRGDSGTLQLDVQPDWNGGEEGDFSLVNVRTPNDPRNLLRLFKNGRYLRFMFADNSGLERDISAAIDDWDAGEVRTITATWGEGRTALYVNGQLVGQNSYDGPLEIQAGTPLYLGSDVPQAGAKGAGSVISNFQVFGRALQGNEIASR